MSKVKAFAALIIIAFIVDMVVFDGLYRERWSRSAQYAAHKVSNLHWTGLVG